MTSSELKAAGYEVVNGRAVKARPVVAPRRATFPRGMNKTENRWQERLLQRKHILKEVQSFEYEAVKLRINDRCWYTPDFLVVVTGGLIEFHEVKGGYIHDDAMVKFKAAAALHPWAVFRMMQWDKGSWTEIQTLNVGKETA
jgi:hypothetical protein